MLHTFPHATVLQQAIFYLDVLEREPRLIRVGLGPELLKQAAVEAFELLPIFDSGIFHTTRYRPQHLIGLRPHRGGDGVNHARIVLLDFFADLFNVFRNFLHLSLQVHVQFIDAIPNHISLLQLQFGVHLNLIPNQVDILFQFLFVGVHRFFEHGNTLINRCLKVHKPLFIVSYTDRIQLLLLQPLQNFVANSLAEAIRLRQIYLEFIQSAQNFFHDFGLLHNGWHIFPQ